MRGIYLALVWVIVFILHASAYAESCSWGADVCARIPVLGGSSATGAAASTSSASTGGAAVMSSIAAWAAKALSQTNGPFSRLVAKVEGMPGGNQLVSDAQQILQKVVSAGGNLSKSTDFISLISTGLKDLTSFLSQNKLGSGELSGKMSSLVSSAMSDLKQGMPLDKLVSNLASSPVVSELKQAFSTNSPQSASGQTLNTLTAALGK